MKTTTKINRGHLLRAARKGMLWVKCSFHYTDDYAYDASVDNGKMDGYKQAYVYREICDPRAAELKSAIEALFSAHHPAMPPAAELNPLQNELSSIRQDHHKAQVDASEGMVMFTERDFRTESGHMNGDTDSGHFNVHSNLSYEYEMRDTNVEAFAAQEALETRVDLLTGRDC